MAFRFGSAPMMFPEDVDDMMLLAQILEQNQSGRKKCKCRVCSNGTDENVDPVIGTFGGRLFAGTPCVTKPIKTAVDIAYDKYKSYCSTHELNLNKLKDERIRDMEKIAQLDAIINGLAVVIPTNQISKLRVEFEQILANGQFEKAFLTRQIKDTVNEKLEEIARFKKEQLLIEFQREIQKYNSQTEPGRRIYIGNDIEKMYADYVRYKANPKSSFEQAFRANYNSKSPAKRASIFDNGGRGDRSNHVESPKGTIPKQSSNGCSYEDKPINKVKIIFNDEPSTMQEFLTKNYPEEAKTIVKEIMEAISSSGFGISGGTVIINEIIGSHGEIPSEGHTNTPINSPNKKASGNSSPIAPKTSENIEPKKDINQLSMVEQLMARSKDTILSDIIDSKNDSLNEDTTEIKPSMEDSKLSSYSLSSSSEEEDEESEGEDEN